MIFEISHKTTYTYSRPVFLELHHLRFRPRSDGVQHVACFDSAGGPQLSAPVSGTFRGNAVSAELRAEIDIRVVNAEAT